MNAVARTKKVYWQDDHCIEVEVLALRDYDAGITGVQIEIEYSRIDFKWEGFSPRVPAAPAQELNAVQSEAHAIKSYYLEEEEFGGVQICSVRRKRNVR